MAAYGLSCFFGERPRKRLRPEAVEQRSWLVALPSWNDSGSDPADPPDPEASEHPFVVDVGPVRAGTTDEKGGTDAAGSLGSSGSLLVRVCLLSQPAGILVQLPRDAVMWRPEVVHSKNTARWGTAT